MTINYEEETFKIDNDNLADWAIKKIAEEEAERDRLLAIARHAIMEYEEQITTINAKYENKTSFLKAKLAEYFNTVPHKNTATQESYKLLSGSLVLKKASQKINHDDEDALIKYLKANKLKKFIKTKTTVAWADFKKLLDISDNKVINIETGEIIDVLKVEDVPASFNIKF